MARKLVFKTAFSELKEKRLVGQGGAGRVYECTDDQGLVWAVKILDPGKASTEKLKRFKNEYNFSLRHPHKNIVSVTDSGIVDVKGKNTPFFVMEYFPLSLRDLLNDRIPTEQVLPLYDQVLSGIQAAHLYSVVHRDLKPENILFSPTENRLVIADFGIAQFSADELYTIVETGPTSRLANFQYAAPEQRAKGRSVDRRADIFALGLILNEMFTGEVAQGTGFRRIRSVAPTFGYLDDLVDRMLINKAEERLSSIEEVKSDLIGRGQAFVEQQRLDQLRQVVVKSHEVTDPLIDDPPRLVDVKWDDGVLTLTLSRPVNAKWMWALQNIGSYSSVMGKPPQAFNFKGANAQIGARDSEAQRIIDFFKDWLPRANQVYAEKVKQEALEATAAERRALQKAIEAAQLKEQVNKQLRI